MTNIVEEAKKFANEAQLVVEQYVCGLQQANNIIIQLCAEITRLEVTNAEGFLVMQRKHNAETDRLREQVADWQGQAAYAQECESERNDKLKASNAYLTKTCDQLEAELKKLRARSLTQTFLDWFRS